LGADHQADSTETHKTTTVLYSFPFILVFNVHRQLQQLPHMRRRFFLWLHEPGLLRLLVRILAFGPFPSCFAFLFT